jgi:DNA polymerase alpha-associated DNA helicase A
LILAGDPKQLPPTILSTGKSARKNHSIKLTEDRSSSKQTDPKSTDQDIAVPERLDEESSNGDSENDDEDEAADTDVETATHSPIIKTTKRITRLIPPRSLEITLFDRLEKMYGSRIKRMLNVQYR